MFQSLESELIPIGNDAIKVVWFRIDSNLMKRERAAAPPAGREKFVTVIIRSSKMDDGTD